MNNDYKYTSEGICNWFLSKINTEAGDTISPLKMQKLLYYAQAWHYTAFGLPLFSENIEAWKHGPVVPSQYQRFKDILREANIPIKEFLKEPPKFETHTEELLEEVLSFYGEHSASYLEALTHREQPWILARGNTPSYQSSNAVISLTSMKEYYSSLSNGEQAS